MRFPLPTAKRVITKFNMFMLYIVRHVSTPSLPYIISTAATIHTLVLIVAILSLVAEYKSHDLLPCYRGIQAVSTCRQGIRMPSCVAHFHTIVAMKRPQAPHHSLWKVY